ncbi:MAG TPA: glycosyltransferase family 39 protein [Polyangiaceae bacterium]|jgi:hypothetical protein
MTRRELLIVAAVSFVILAVAVAPLSTPYWWDAGAVYAPGAKWLLDHGFDARPGVFPADLSRGHTALFYLMLAAAYRVMGAGPVAGHVVTFAFAWMAVIFSYALARRLFGWQAAALAALLLVASPLFQTMASMALPEMAMTALTAASLYAFARGRIAESAALGTVLVLVKEVGVACPLAIAGAVALEALRHRDRTGIRRTAIALVPVVVLAVFFGVQKSAEGWFVLPYHAGLFHEHHPLLPQLGRVAVSLVADGRWIAVLAALVLWRRAELARAWREHREVFTAFVLFAAMNLGFFAKMFFLERYVLPVHVCVAIMIGGALARVRWPGLAAAAIAIGVALSRRSAGTDMASGETTFRYLHAVHAHAALLHRVDTAGGDPRILTVWPVTDELRQPFLGWVHRPFHCMDADVTSSPGPVDRIIAVRGLGSFERLQREARARGFSLRDRAEEGSAAIELWGP